MSTQKIKGSLARKLFFTIGLLLITGGGIVRPSVIETDSPLYKGYKSVMIFANVKARNLKDEVFTLTFMPNLESLR